MRRLALLAAVVAVLCVPNHASAASITFTAGDIKAAMADNGAPLANGTNQWGLWAVRVMPIVTGTGIYTITSGSTTQDGWGVSAPNGAFGAAPFTDANSAWFWDESGSEGGGAANPLYMIMSQPANTFESYAYVPAGTWSGTCTDSAQPGCNLVTAVSDSAQFTVDFTLGSGATLAGWQFVVDGSEYMLGTEGDPGAWVQDFFGGYGNSGDLAGNTGAGFPGPEPQPVPEPATLSLVGLGLAGVVRAARRRKQ